MRRNLDALSIVILAFGNCLPCGEWREKVWVQCRLDRSFVNDGWFSLFPRSNMEYIWRCGPMTIAPSGYALLWKEMILRGTIPSLIKDWYTRHGLTEELVKQSWGEEISDSSNTMNRIARCRKNILKWKKNSDTNSRTKIIRLSAALEKEVAKVNPSSNRMKKLKQNLGEAIREEEDIGGKNVGKNG